MPNFHYKGRAQDGRAIDGHAEASSVDALAALLMGRGITPVTIKETRVSVSLDQTLNKLFGEEKVKPVDLIMFSRQMYTITKSGIPLSRGIRGLAASLKHEAFRVVLLDIADRLEAGSSLSVAMSNHPKVFNHLFVSMINVGESTGGLDVVFQQMAFYMERDEETRKSIKAALRYPTFVVIALVIAITVVNIFVIPAFSDLFSRFDAELPILTKLLIGTSNFFVNYWWLLKIIVVGGTFGIYSYLKTPDGKMLWGRKKLTMFLVGDIINRASMARYTRSFALMLSAGVPLNQALLLCGRAIDNPYLSQKIEGIRRGIERGDSLLRTHTNAQMFSPLILQMIAVGEESGQVEALLKEVAEFYEREVDYDLKKLSDKIEPILIIVMAVFVAILALGIFLPMWDLHRVQSSG